MKTKKAFTLVELLVVIAVIALLLAILLPSLGKAKDLANRIVCGHHLKTFGQASNVYAGAYDGFYVPLVFEADGPDPSTGDFTEDVRYIWAFNLAFRKYIQKEELTGDEDYAHSRLLSLPKEFLCPSDKVSKDSANLYASSVLLSYAYNGQEWGWIDGIETAKYVGYKSDLLKAPADKLQFTDSIDWWCVWYPGADYRIGWDKLGQANIDQYKGADPRVDAPVMYRHNEGAMCGFYDGHAEHMKKTEVFVAEDYDASPEPSGNWCGMWTASGWTTK